MPESHAAGIFDLPARADELAGFDVHFPSGAFTRCLIGAGALAQLSPELVALSLTGTSGFLCDARLVTVQKELVDRLGKELGGTLARPVREDRKSLAEVEAMADVLAARGLHRDGFVVALGGGVLTDLAGLAAALYQRGLPWVCLPTTLLAQVDAGLGGKTGANLRSGKNLVGAFHQPRLVVCDTQVLSTLPVRERWSGLAEIVKCALLDPMHDAAGEPFLARCERTLELAASGDADALAPLIAAAIRIKAEIVCADEREGEKPKLIETHSPAEAPPSTLSPLVPRPPMLRAFLNLGHTVGHALEAATGYSRFTHGEAVALGLHSAIALSRIKGLLDEDSAERGFKLLARFQIAAPLQLSTDERELALSALAKDKKARAGQIRFVLLKSFGAPELVPISPAEAAQALDAAFR